MDHVQPALQDDVRMPEAVEVAKNCLLVAKPGIIFGNLICAAAGFLLASKGRVEPALFLSIMVGISLVVASGCVLNNCIDRNMDRKMTRTRNRVLVRGLISLEAAIWYACLLGIAGLALLWTVTNLLSVLITLTGFAVYVGIYSLYLKRNSIYGALVGSLAGAAPPLAGYCAVSGRFDLGAVILLFIFSLWQMPHCYAIAIFRFDDYAAAGVPVLPIERGLPTAKRHIFGYAVAFMAVTLTLTFTGYTGYGYLVAAALLGFSWLYLIVTGCKAHDERLWAKKVFALSILSIFVVSVMMSIDFTVPDTPKVLLTFVP